jgi:hypothetical protein
MKENKIYNTHRYLLNWGNLEKLNFRFKDLEKFSELNNLSISIWVVHKNEGKGQKSRPYIAKNIHRPKKYFEDKHITLLYLSEEIDQYYRLNSGKASDILQQGHYVLINNIQKFLRGPSLYKHLMFCHICGHKFAATTLFKNQERLKDHLELCSGDKDVTITLPNPDRTLVKPKITNQEVRVVIYFDTEAILERVDNQKSERTTEYQNHKLCGWGIKVKSDLPGVRNYIEVNRYHKWEDASEAFARKIDGECQLIQKAYEAAGITNYFIPVIAHNSAGYDTHMIIGELLKRRKGVRIQIISQTIEKYMGFKSGKMKFLDSYKFLNSPLDELIANQLKDVKAKTLEGYKAVFPETLKDVRSVKEAELMLRKGVYPYDYMDSFDKFRDTKLPAQELFFSELKQSGILDEDYAHAQEYWKFFKMRHMGDYHDSYLKNDINQLCDVFENFRQKMINDKGNEIDPVNCWSLPGETWCAWLKKHQSENGTPIHSFNNTQKDMYLAIENGIRGGISMIGQRYSEGINRHTIAATFLKYLPWEKPQINLEIPLIIADYLLEQESRYILSVDAVSLYSKAMTYSMPCSDFEWLDKKGVKKYQKYINSGSLTRESLDAEETGSILEVDCHIPDDKHDALGNYPFPPNNEVITEEQLSKWQKKHLKKAGKKQGDGKKLVLSLLPKKKYFMHLQNWLLYTSLGMETTKVHRVMVFKQSPVLKSYVEQNASKRKNAKSETEKQFFKLLNNALYGKTMENVRKHSNYLWPKNYAELDKLMMKPNFHSWKVFNDNYIAVQMLKTSVKVNKPMALGFTVLEMSKVIMFDFFHNKIKKKFGDRVHLLMTDTDSLVMEIKSKDLYQELLLSPDLLEAMDLSEFPLKHPLHSKVNAKVSGKFKVELAPYDIVEFLGEAAKFYNIVHEPSIYHDNYWKKFTSNHLPESTDDIIQAYLADSNEKKTAKGIQKSLKDTIYREQYYHSIHDDYDLKTVETRRFATENHEIHSIMMKKEVFNSINDKLHMLNRVIGIPHGHYSLKNLDKSNKKHKD